MSTDEIWLLLFVFFFNDTATTEIYTLSLHDALPISGVVPDALVRLEHQRIQVEHAELAVADPRLARRQPLERAHVDERSEEHTSELQSRQYLVCRLLLEKKKNTTQS